MCVALSTAVAPAKLLLRSLYRCLATKANWRDKVLLSAEALRDLHWWRENLCHWTSSHATPPPPSMDLQTDASQTGWGATCREKLARGTWTAPESHRSSNWWELQAVLLALHTFLPDLKGQSVRLLSENATTVTYVNCLGGTHRHLDLVARESLSLCVKNGITLRAIHIPGVNNTVPDLLSRWVDHFDWCLHPQTFQELDRLWDPHTVDRMASSKNNLLPRFNSRFWEPLAEAADCFAQPWGGENPPFRLLPVVLQKVSQDGALATIIAPLWPSQPWFQQLLSMSIAPPYLLHRADCLPGESGMPEPLRNTKWRLAAFRVSGKPPSLPGPRRPGTP
jgi:hypothetical protein